ncbi:MAG: 50S ribosomal protein L21 [Bacteroidota bacterium]|jgi:large subunit ribosomal protein L21
MYAVVEIGGHQYKVAEDDVIFVDRQSEEKDGEISFDRVMLINDGDNTTVGTPVVEGAEVKAKVLDHLKDDKVMVFKKKRRKGYRVKRGHRQHLTQLKIENISA